VTDALLQVDATAVIRGVLRGRPWYEQAVLVLESDASSVTAARWPGTGTREISFYAQSLGTEDPGLRDAARDALARGDWELIDSAWRWTGVLERVVSGRWFSVSRMFDPDGALRCWYLNFQRPRPGGPTAGTPAISRSTWSSTRTGLGGGRTRTSTPTISVWG
jgi:hypothetical protein